MAEWSVFANLPGNHAKRGKYLVKGRAEFTITI
jgi:hypothetical protein